MLISRETKFYGWVSRMTTGFYLGALGHYDKIPRDALLFFGGGWVLYQGLYLSNPPFQGAIDNRWVIRAGAPPFTWGDVEDADPMKDPYCRIRDVFWESPGKWCGLDKGGQLVTFLSDQGASDVFRAKRYESPERW